MADLIATQEWAEYVGEYIGGNPNIVPDNLCCTKSRAEDVGCTVKGNYANNQLVCKKNLVKEEWH